MTYFRYDSVAAFRNSLFMYLGPPVGVTRDPFVDFSAKKIYDITKLYFEFFKSRSYLACAAWAELWRQPSNFNNIVERKLLWCFNDSEKLGKYFPSLMLIFSCRYRRLRHQQLNSTWVLKHQGLYQLSDKSTARCRRAWIHRPWYKNVRIALQFRRCLNNTTSIDPFYWHGLALIPARISNCILYNVWDEITYPFPSFNGTTLVFIVNILNYNKLCASPPYMIIVEYMRLYDWPTLLR